MEEKENKFIIIIKKEKPTSLTIRLDKDLSDILDEISYKTGRSRNELINLALNFAFHNLSFSTSFHSQDKKTTL